VADRSFKERLTVARSLLEDLEMRLTYRTLRVLSAIAANPGASNRDIADHADVKDQGQISKLLIRLERLGLIHNTGTGALRGEPNAWILTDKGQEVEGAAGWVRRHPRASSQLPRRRNMRKTWGISPDGRHEPAVAYRAVPRDERY
jgi:hypothetical protein